MTEDIKCLPLPEWTERNDGIPLYSTQTLREYARAHMARERERCALIVERISGWAGAREIAAEIRGEETQG